MKAKILVILFLKSQEWLSIRSDHRSLGNLTATSVEVNYGTKDYPVIHVGKIIGEARKLIMEGDYYSSVGTYYTIWRIK